MADPKKEYLQIIHELTGEVIAEGPVGLRGLLPFEGNFYIHPRCLKTRGFRPNWIPGLCIYKFFYVWLDFHASNGRAVARVVLLVGQPTVLSGGLQGRRADGVAGPQRRAGEALRSLEFAMDGPRRGS